MFSNLYTYLQFGNEYCGIEHTSVNQESSIVSTVLKKTKKEVDIEAFLQARTIKDLSGQLQKKQHAYLVVNDNQVLSKIIESDGADDIQLVNKAFPNINLKDFYFEIIKQVNTHFISISRKAHIDELVSKYKSNGIQIIDFSLGNSIFSNVSAFIDTEEVRTSNAEIILKERGIKTIEKIESSETKTYDINGLQVDNQRLLSLSGALSAILRKQESKTNFGAQKQSLQDDYKQSRFFTQFSKAGLVFILGLLLINFFVFNNYFDKVNSLQATSQINQTTKAKVLGMSEKVIKVEKMVNDMLEGSSSMSSFYINAIIQSLPNSVLLSELNYQPLIKRIKADTPIEVDKANIIVSGASNNSEAFLTWLTLLENYSWIKKTEIIEYGSDSGRRSDFNIKIIIND